MRLPVSGLEVSFRLPDGYDDLAILEFSGTTSAREARNTQNPQDAFPTREAQAVLIERALDTLQRLTTLEPPPAPLPASPLPLAAQTVQNDPWSSLTVTDFETALLGLRRFLFGDTVLCFLRCVCSERMEIEFSIADLLHQAHPRTPRRVVPSPTRHGWFELRDKPDSEARELHAGEVQTQGDPERQPTSFRLPTILDQLAALRSPHPLGLLKHRCIDAPSRGSRTGSRALERAMETMSPAVSRPIDARCAACDASLTPQLHVPSLVLEELRASASAVHGEIHALAATYHWEEPTILAMPQLRRRAYNEAIHNQAMYAGGAQ
jgi:hypothetical protein